MSNTKTVKPSEVGYDESRLEYVDRHFKRLMDKNILQSANYCLSRNGKVFADRAIGKQSYIPEDTRPLATDAIHRIASITKLFCATALFKLFEDGYLRPLQPVSDIIPEFKDAPFNEINIAHLLTHTSGLRPDVGVHPYKYLECFDYVAECKPGDNWIEAALKAGMSYKPGEQWAYCSFGYIFLGEIIKRVTGMEPDTYIRKVILEPCKMTDTCNNREIDRGEISPEYIQKLKDRFYIQNENDKRYIERLNSYEPGKTFGNSERIWMHIPGTAGSMLSTAQDLNKFGRMLLNGGVTEDGTRVLGRKAIERMTENYIYKEVKDYTWGNKGGPRMYALGPDTRWNADSHFSKGSFFHEGSGACALLMDPVENMVAVWFTPWVDESKWYAEAVFNAASVMWSGLE